MPILESLLKKASNSLHQILNDENGAGGDYSKNNETPLKPYKKNRVIPDYSKGIEASSLEDIVHSEAEIIKLIKHIVDQQFWKEYYLPIIYNFASYAHLLPASESHHHRGIGGLFRHGLEVGYQALYVSEDRVAGNDLYPSERREYIPRWKFAIFCSGLCHDIGKPLTDMTIVSKDGEKIWNPFAESLHSWLTTEKVESYSIIWRKGREGQHSLLGPMISYEIIGKKSYGWISKGSPELPFKMAEAIMGSEGGNNIIRDIVRISDARSVQNDLKNTANISFGDIGIPVERFIIDAMRRLYQKDKSKNFLYVNNEMLVNWRVVSKKILEILSADNIPGIPKDPDTLADILIDRNFAVGTHDREIRFRYWLLSNCKEIGITRKEKMLKLQNYSLLSDMEPENVFGYVIPYSTKNLKGGAGEPTSTSEAQPTNNSPEQIVTPAPPAPEPEEDLEGDFDLFLKNLTEEGVIIVKFLAKNFQNNNLSYFLDQDGLVNLDYPKGLPSNTGFENSKILKVLVDSNLVIANHKDQLKKVSIVKDPEGKERKVIIFSKNFSDFVQNYREEQEEENNSVSTQPTTPAAPIASKISEEKKNNDQSLKTNDINTGKTENVNTPRQSNHIKTPEPEVKNPPASTNNEENNKGNSNESQIIAEFTEKHPECKPALFALLDTFTLLLDQKMQAVRGELDQMDQDFVHAKFSRQDSIVLPRDIVIKRIAAKTKKPRGMVEKDIAILLESNIIKQGEIKINDVPTTVVGIHMNYLKAERR